MTVSEITARLNLPAQTIAALQKISLPVNYAALKSSFYQNTSLFSDFAENDATGLTVLKLYLHWAIETLAMYEDLQIPQQYFWDSMKDIPIWCEDYLTKHGVPGFREWGWVAHGLRLEVIRIGRLQFEPSVLSHNVTIHGINYPSGTPVLDVHIPTGEPLNPEAVLASISQAPEFFKRHFGKHFSLFHCHSWLLSPSLKALLPEQSRIIQFQNLFTVYKTENEERQAEERVFGFLSDDPQEYPESTALQKAIKNYMLNGNEVMMGAGIRPIV